MHVGVGAGQRGAAGVDREGERVFVETDGPDIRCPPGREVRPERDDAHRVALVDGSAALSSRRRTFPDAVRGITSTKTNSSTCL